MYALRVHPRVLSMISVSRISIPALSRQNFQESQGPPGHYFAMTGRCALGYEYGCMGSTRYEGLLKNGHRCHPLAGWYDHVV